jgi:mannitol-specific phosphotransferase system IIBC component
LLAAVVANQAPGPVVAEFVVTSCIKSLEDDSAVVQVAYAKTLAQALYCQMRAQAEHQEKQSVSKNRGDISEESSATPSASSMSAGGQNVVGTKTTARISSKISTAFSAAMGSSKNGKILDEYTLSSSGTSIRNLRWLKISSLTLTPLIHF